MMHPCVWNHCPCRAEDGPCGCRPQVSSFLQLRASLQHAVGDPCLCRRASSQLRRYDATSLLLPTWICIKFRSASVLRSFNFDYSCIRSRTHSCFGKDHDARWSWDAESTYGIPPENDNEQIDHCNLSEAFSSPCVTERGFPNGECLLFLREFRYFEDTRRHLFLPEYCLKFDCEVL